MKIGPSDYQKRVAVERARFETPDRSISPGVYENILRQVELQMMEEMHHMLKQLTKRSKP